MPTINRTTMRNLTLWTLLLPVFAICQNEPPEVTITGVALDEISNTVTVTYDLVDLEEEACTVRFSASDNGGDTFTVDVSLATGDLGPNITPATGLGITWNYTGLADILSVTIKVTVDDGNAPDIQAMVDQVDEQSLADALAHVAIPRHHNSSPNGLAAVRDSLWNTFTSTGLRTSASAVTYLGSQADNVIGRHPGIVDELNTYIVDAHYDAVANVAGADDNATGVVATMAIARILANYHFENSLRFIGFAFEEQGLVGSQHFVQNEIPAWEQISGVLNMEMIGYYSNALNSQTVPTGFDLLFPTATADIASDGYRGNFLTVVGNMVSQPLIDSFLMASSEYVPQLRCIALAAPGNSQIAPDLRRSDHAPFWDSGRQALMLTDGSNFRNPNYHTVNDVIASIDMPFLTNCTKAVLATAARLAVPINAGSDSFEMVLVLGLNECNGSRLCGASVIGNPATNIIEVQLDECIGTTVVVGLYDMSGRSILQQELRPKVVRERIRIPIHHLASGTYVLRLASATSATALKVEVE